MNQQVICYLDPEGSYGHYVAKELKAHAYDGSARLLGMESHAQILDAVSRDATGTLSGIVAMYNSTQGLVEETIHYWIQRENQRGRYLALSSDSLIAPNLLHVIGKISMPINHQLLVCDSAVRLDEIKRVLSHPQGIAQCSRTIAAVMPGAVRERVSSIRSRRRW